MFPCTYYVIKIVNCTLCSWSKKLVTRGQHMAIYRCQNCFPSFIVRWILNFVDQPTHENWYPTNKSDFTVSVFYFVCNKNISKFN